MNPYYPEGVTDENFDRLAWGDRGEEESTFVVYFEYWHKDQADEDMAYLTGKLVVEAYTQEQAESNAEDFCQKNGHELITVVHVFLEMEKDTFKQEYERRKALRALKRAA